MGDSRSHPNRLISQRPKKMQKWMDDTEREIRSLDVKIGGVSVRVGRVDENLGIGENQDESRIVPLVDRIEKLRSDTESGRCCLWVALAAIIVFFSFAIWFPFPW